MDIKELANRIYDLDQMVYSSLGSALGHVFNRDRDKALPLCRMPTENMRCEADLLSFPIWHGRFRIRNCTRRQ